MKKIVLLLTLFFVSLFFPLSSFAKVLPTAQANNKFGIHITNEEDLNLASSLVNSSGGDWGYITLVITQDERDQNRWQNIFNQMRRLHLIPIVRIATKADGDTWQVPDTSDISNWVKFLDSLNWVVENRYIVIGNEPNHTNEWGGEIDPAAYTKYLKQFSQDLHGSSEDYFVLPAALDASATNSSDTMDESLFIKRMLNSEPDIFDSIDGWTSHSYPNPDYSGNPADTGRGSIQTYIWELNLLESLGINNKLPVFITETGWSNEKLTPETIGENYKYAFEHVWNDKQIVAVTPFILNYPSLPFSQFSWIGNDKTPYYYFEEYKNLKKVAGNPVQKESGQILGAFIQPIIPKSSDFIGVVIVKNTGQSIWSDNNYQLTTDSNDVAFANILFLEIEPEKTGLIVFKGSIANKSGLLLKSVYLASKLEKRITNSFPIEGFIINSTSLSLKTLWEKMTF